MKRFWKKTEGFTLVELIVVIAILGILAGVGTVGYSGYVKKANMAADKTLASEVANALTLHAYSDPGATGFVLLTTDGATGDGGAGDAAMEAAFGSEWETTAKLKYDGWHGGTLPSATDAQVVMDSSYFKYNSPADLVKSFSNLTDSLSGMAATASQDPLTTLVGLNGGAFMSAMEAEAIRDQLDDLDVNWDKDKEAYTTAVANLLVKKTADEIGNYDGTNALSGMSSLATNYALLYGWGISTEEGRVVLDALNATLTDPDTDSDEVLEAVDDAMTTAGGSTSFTEYMAASEETDGNALITIMGTVSDWTDDADMTASGLYSSASISAAVNGYVGAVSTVSGLNDEQKVIWNEWDGEGTVVYVDAAGVAYCPILSE